jgi:hypothetical protein
VDVDDRDPALAFETRQRLVDVLNRTAGVTAAAVVNGVPALSLPEGVVRSPGEYFDAVVAYQGTSGFAAVMGMTLEVGRLVSDHEGRTGAPVALVDRGAADIMWPGEPPLGKTLRLYSGRDLTVVGVLARARTSLGEPGELRGTVLAAPDLTTTESRGFLRSIVLRLDPRRPATAATLAEAVLRGVPGATFIGAAGLTSWSRYTGQPRFLASALGLLGGLTIALAACGVLGVVSHLVARRTREIGIRMALGADRMRVRALVLRQALVPAAVGVVAGMLLAFWWSESVRAVIVGVSARDPWSFAGAAVATLATVALASLRPAIHASRVDPARTLRAE